MQKQQVTPANDLFALGVVLYQALVGERPFRGTSVDELLEQITQRPLPALPQQFAELRPLLEILLSADAEQRLSVVAPLNEQFETIDTANVLWGEKQRFEVTM